MRWQHHTQEEFDITSWFGSMTSVRFVASGICLCSLMLLSACEQGPAPPAIVDIEVAARTWNTAQKTWSEPDLYLLEKGRRLYQKNCAGCHLSSGTGQQTLGAPALKGNAIARGPADALIALVLDGRNVMPAFRTSIDASSLAAILSYVRNAWGNNTAEIIETATVTTLMYPAGLQGQDDKVIVDE